ncbi:MAG: CotH kinase family protein, partial [Bacteroidales bacterium]|nr:CotH kinase family protein [Bacteroidales bacterium]
SNTVALYEVDNKNLPIRIDHSNKSYIEIPTPKKCWVNFLHNFAPVDQQLLLKYQPGEIEYFDTNRNYFRKKCEYAWQGSSSLNYFKKNWKIKFYNEDGSKCYIKIGEWIPRSQFHFKGDGMDVTRIKNSGTAKLIQKLYRIRGYSYMPWTQKPYDMNNPSIRDRFDTGALGVIDSVPCIIQSFDTPLGRYHLNLNKFPENFNAYEDDPVNRVFAGSMPFNENYNKNSVEELVIDKEGADLPDDIFRVLGNLMDWLISVKSDVSAYKEGFDTRFDLDNCLDYYCLVWMGDYFDNVSANFMMPTYDGVKFYYMWYDMDRGYGFGSGALADTYRPPTVNNTFTGHGANYMWQNFELAFADEIKARYAELRRSGFISVTNVETTFRDLFNRCTPADVEQDLLYWWYRCNTNVPGKYSSIQQFMCWLKDRLIFLDDKFSYIE